MANEGEENSAQVNAPSALEQADVKLGAKLASTREHPIVKAAGFASKVGDQEPLYALSAGVLVIGFATRDRKLTDTGLAMFVAVALSDLAKSGIKRAVSRTRPHVLLDERSYDADLGGSARKPEQSFPSGHMAASVAAARALSRNHPAPGAAAGLAAVAIGISRVAKAAHWPLDIVAGAIVGLLAEAVGLSALRLTSKRK